MNNQQRHSSDKVALTASESAPAIIFLSWITFTWDETSWLEDKNDIFIWITCPFRLKTVTSSSQTELHTGQPLSFCLSLHSTFFFWSVLSVSHLSSVHRGNKEAYFVAVSTLGLSWTFFGLPLSYQPDSSSSHVKLAVSNIVISLALCGAGLPGYCLSVLSEPLASNTHSTVTPSLSPTAT